MVIGTVFLMMHGNRFNVEFEYVLFILHNVTLILTFVKILYAFIDSRFVSLNKMSFVLLIFTEILKHVIASSYAGLY